MLEQVQGVPRVLIYLVLQVSSTWPSHGWDLPCWLPASPCHSFFSLSLSLSLFLRMTLCSTGALWAHWSGRASKTQSGRRLASSGEGTPCVFTPPRGCLWSLWTEQVRCHGHYWLSVETKEDQASFSPLYLSSFADAVPPEGISGSCRGWTPVVWWALRAWLW